MQEEGLSSIVSKQRRHYQICYSQALLHIDAETHKPQFTYCKIDDIESLKTLLKTQSISVTTEKVISGQLKNDDLINSEKSLNQENTRGCRLAWSRLVDLGSIDSGSNPGSPIQRF